ncbi:unnamed protein product [Bacillus thuringiensis DB27]|uniref:Uncharacterized protein n=1 Tax=Bacillus thuringiensis DB27 TaxID=1431339 RepID=W8YDC7_BACTU|nr:unnamed protein product [Bacillus thuringiensis DB27]
MVVMLNAPYTAALKYMTSSKAGRIVTVFMNKQLQTTTLKKWE